MAALAFDGTPEPAPQRNRMQRILDALAEWLMRQELRVISRDQTARATIASVTQPSSTNERSSTNP